VALSSYDGRAARQPGCGKLLRASTTTPAWKHAMGTQGNDLVHSKNVEDWTIRRRVPKSVMIGYGTVSETAKVSVFDEVIFDEVNNSHLNMLY
jgi:hypothetical protein